MGELFECFEPYDVQATRREARAEGRTEGIIAGKELLLINMVCKKLEKGKTVPQIAEELEENVPKIEQICQAVKTFDSEYDEEDVLNILMRDK